MLVSFGMQTKWLIDHLEKCTAQRESNAHLLAPCGLLIGRLASRCSCGLLSYNLTYTPHTPRCRCGAIVDARDTLRYGSGAVTDKDGDGRLQWTELCSVRASNQGHAPPGAASEPITK